jgi:hypothetical protein
MFNLYRRSWTSGGFVTFIQNLNLKYQTSFQKRSPTYISPAKMCFNLGIIFTFDLKETAPLNAYLNVATDFD